MENQDLTVSYCHGGSEAPLEFWRSFDQLPRFAADMPDKEMLVFRQPNTPRVSISFAEFHRLTDGVAGHLIRHCPDLQAGQNVLLMGPCCLEYCVVATGLHKAGLVTLKLHPEQRQSLEAWTRLTESKGVFYDAEGAFQTGASWLQDVVSVLMDFDSLMRKGREALAEDGLQDILRQRQSQISADNFMSIYPTSGSTGRPKLVAHTHFAMVNSVRFRAIGALLTSEDVFYTDRTAAHMVGDFGLMTSMLIGLRLVVTRTESVVSDRGAKNAEWLLDMLEEEQVTSGDFFGYLVHDLLHKIERPMPKSLRSGLIAGSLTTSQMMEKVMKVIPGIVNYYGSSETSLMTAVEPPCGPNSDPEVRRNTVGRAATHMELMVSETGNSLPIPLPIGSIGEVWSRGYSIMRGYYKEPEKTREVLTETGWYRTGDLGRMDTRGRLTVTGRVKELIIRATVNIVPSCVEDFLRAHPDVLAVQVVGVPDERLGEEIAACLVLRPERRVPPELQRQAAQQFAQWCIENGCFKAARDGLSMVPRYWAFLEEFPKRGINKVVRSELRQYVMNGSGFIDGLEFLGGE